MVIGVALIGAIGAGSIALIGAIGVGSAGAIIGDRGHGMLVDHHLFRRSKLTLRKKLLASALVGA